MASSSSSVGPDCPGLVSPYSRRRANSKEVAVARNAFLQRAGSSSNLGRADGLQRRARSLSSPSAPLAISGADQWLLSNRPRVSSDETNRMDALLNLTTTLQGALREKSLPQPSTTLTIDETGNIKLTPLPLSQSSDSKKNTKGQSSLEAKVDAIVSYLSSLVKQPPISPTLVKKTHEFINQLNSDPSIGGIATNSPTLKEITAFISDFHNWGHTPQQYLEQLLEDPSAPAEAIVDEIIKKPSREWDKKDYRPLLMDQSGKVRDQAFEISKRLISKTLPKEKGNCLRGNEFPEALLSAWGQTPPLRLWIVTKIICELNETIERVKSKELLEDARLSSAQTILEKSFAAMIFLPPAFMSLLAHTQREVRQNQMEDPHLPCPIVLNALFLRIIIPEINLQIGGPKGPSVTKHVMRYMSQSEDPLFPKNVALQSARSNAAMLLESYITAE